MTSRVIIFCPRYHTNMIGWVEGLISNGYSIKMVVFKKRLPESYSFCEPLLFKSSICAPLLDILTKIPAVGRFIADRGLTSASNFRSIRQTFSFLISYKPNIYLIRSPTLPYHILVICFALFTRKRVVFYTQTPLDYPFPSSFNKYLGLISKTLKIHHFSPITRTFCQSYQSKNSFSHFVPFSIPSSFAIGNYSDHLSKDRSNNVLIVTKMVDFKNNGLIVELLQKIPSSIHFTIVIGFINSPTLKLREAALRKSLLGFDNVTLKSNVTPENMLSIYETCGYYILLSRNEPANFSLIESMSQGLVVFSPFSNGSSCYIDNLKSGFVYDDNDLSFIAQKITYLACNRSEYCSISTNAKLLSVSLTKISNLYHYLNYISG